MCLAMNRANPEISLKPLKEALNSLKSSLDQPLNEFTRDSTIQRFEYCFELSWKSLKRYFLWNQNLDESNVKNLFREAGKQQLINNVEQWFEFHKARNITSHTYSEEVAKKVYDTAKEFYPEAIHLLEQLEILVQ